MLITEKARMFADAAHSAIGQVRKYTGLKYITHCEEMVSLLLEVGCRDTSMLAAALLHDVVEDTQITIEHIREVFGDDIAELVDGLTDVSKPEDGNRAFRKNLDLQHTAKQSARCKTIKLADLISNSRSIIEHDPKFAKVYLPEKMALMEVLHGGNTILYAKAKELLEEGFSKLGLK